jgi:hypothetical protein
MIGVKWTLLTLSYAKLIRNGRGYAALMGAGQYRRLLLMKADVLCPAITRTIWIMAKVLGQSGRYVNQAAVNKSRRWVAVALVVEALLGVTCGVFLSPALLNTSLSMLTRGVLGGVFVLAMALTLIWAIRKSTGLETESKRGPRLSSQEIDILARAFCRLAHMDTNFTAQAERHERPRVAAIVERQRPAPSEGFGRFRPYGHATAA